MSKNWDIRFLRLAREVSTWSKDPSTKVGAVITNSENHIVSLGFNGFPKDVKDVEEFYNNREEKYKRVVHAEMNAVLFARGRDLGGSTLFTYPIPPCPHCAPVIIQAGIKRVVSLCLDNNSDPWLRTRQENWKETSKILEEAGVKFATYHPKNLESCSL